jgi:hypothetical protein
MNKSIKIICVFAVMTIITVVSCTDLSETLYSEIESSKFYQTEKEIISALVPAYADLRVLCHLRGCGTMETFSTDEALLPTRGRHWYDGGNFQRFSEHTWTPEVVYINTAWTQQFQMVNRANMLIYQFSNLKNMDPDLKDAFTAELYCIRALGYYNLLNSFGNVPIVDRFDVPQGYQPSNNADFQQGRKDVFNFIENDLLNNIDKLSDKQNSSTYGRFNKWSAAALLTKLYINAQVWTGTPKWDEAITYADMIINSKLFSLEPNYFANFFAQNEGSKENILVVPFDEYRTGSGWGSNNTVFFYLCGQHHQGRKIFNVPHAATSGSCAIPSFYKSFDENDVRRNGWSVGPQYDMSTGQPILCTEESAPNPLVYTVDFENIYNPSDPSVYDHKNALEYQGARLVKYQIDYDGNGMSNDYAYIRYSDILLLKAEALIRKNNGVATQDAVDLVNLVRDRAFNKDASKHYTIATLTLDQLCKERGWEFYHEGFRRNDLVRFGKFVRGTWEFFDRSAESDNFNVYSIPQRQINANPSLKQNPGY